MLIISSVFSSYLCYCTLGHYEISGIVQLFVVTLAKIKKVVTPRNCVVLSILNLC